MSEEPIVDGPITQAQIDGLLTKLEEIEDLGNNQRKLLDAMIKMAREVEGVTVSSSRPVFREGFPNDSFTPGAAEVVLSYGSDESDSESASTQQSQVTQYITRISHP